MSPTPELLIATAEIVERQERGVTIVSERLRAAADRIEELEADVKAAAELLSECADRIERGGTSLAPAVPSSKEPTE